MDGGVVTTSIVSLVVTTHRAGVGKISCDCSVS